MGEATARRLARERGPDSVPRPPRRLIS
jgi:hypothetical protein